ncbi:MAG: hypothetical protein CVT94_11985 [Bacteroidetes bacterium HGW-Bacteroidetes-11]|jgi:hypothetical protein|nr:MAG: hypothetical protein CVT94_11985 [Bacteroidetes bacterium HGW-Bacteroidetes-11]
MLYSKEFVEIVKNGVGNYYIGIGNPDANILIVGKESAISDDKIDDKISYRNNASDWDKHIEDNTCQTLSYLVHKKGDKNLDNEIFDKDHPLFKGWGRNTWSKYQQLYDFINGYKTQKFYVNFLKNVFTTEINDSPSPKTSSANKKGLSQRKELFKNSAFIQKFPVVVLACSDYIDNVNAKEINEIFGVTYDGDEKGKHLYSSGNWFYTHHDSTGQKLVIHTRQLSANVDGKMLEDMGKVIREHLKQHS